MRSRDAWLANQNALPRRKDQIGVAQDHQTATGKGVPKVEYKFAATDHNNIILQVSKRVCKHMFLLHVRCYVYSERCAPPRWIMFVIN